MSLNEKFGPIRKGLLEFLILKIIAADKVYVADMLRKLAGTEFATQEGTLYPLLSRMRRDGLVDYEWQESEAGPPRKYYQLTAKGRSQLAELADYWTAINRTIESLGKTAATDVPGTAGAIEVADAAGAIDATGAVGATDAADTVQAIDVADAVRASDLPDTAGGKRGPGGRGASKQGK